MYIYLSTYCYFYFTFVFIFKLLFVSHSQNPINMILKNQNNSQTQSLLHQAQNLVLTHCLVLQNNGLFYNRAQQSLAFPRPGPITTKSAYLHL